MLGIGLLPVCRQTDSSVDFLLITAAEVVLQMAQLGSLLQARCTEIYVSHEGFRAVNLKCAVICAIRVSPLFGFYNIFNRTDVQFRSDSGLIELRVTVSYSVNITSSVL